MHGCLARGGAGETFWAPDPGCVGGPRICVSCLSLSIQRSQLHSCCPAVRRGSQAHSQTTVLRVVWTWSRGEEDPGTWAKDWMGTCSWNWLAPAWSPSFAARPSAALPGSEWDGCSSGLHPLRLRLQLYRELPQAQAGPSKSQARYESSPPAAWA